VFRTHVGDNVLVVTSTLPPVPLDADRPQSASQPPVVPRWVIASFLLGGALFLAIAAFALASRTGHEGPSDAGGEWAGRVLEPAQPRPSFILTDTSGAPYDFEAQTRGHLTLVFFGYTNCPDVCPVQLATIAQALQKVDVPVEVVFVTTDPARDTPERLDSWVHSFRRDFIGLTGDQTAVEAAQQAMGATVAVAQESNSRGDYLVGHTSGVFVITPDDRVRLVYPFGTRQEDWVRDLPRLAKAQWPDPSTERPS
jgi:protein SCO1/2